MKQEYTIVVTYEKGGKVWQQQYSFTGLSAVLVKYTQMQHNPTVRSMRVLAVLETWGRP